MAKKKRKAETMFRVTVRFPKSVARMLKVDARREHFETFADFVRQAAISAGLRSRAKKLERAQDSERLREVFNDDPESATDPAFADSDPIIVNKDGTVTRPHRCPIMFGADGGPMLQCTRAVGHLGSCETAGAPEEEE